MVDHILIHTGQNYDYELNEIFFSELGIRKPDHFLNCATASPISSIADILQKLDPLLERLRPQAALLYGDTNSCLSAIAIKKKNIPLFHMEAGNRCFDARVPEDLNRKIVDAISDINMPLTERARSYLIREGFPPDQIVKIGSCMHEVLTHFAAPIAARKILAELQEQTNSYFLLSLHREENVDDPSKLLIFIDLIRHLRTTYGKSILVSTHPRTRDRLAKAGIPLDFDSKVRFLKPFGFLDYVHLQQHAACVLSDSGTLMEESSILGFPAIHLRDSYERPEGMEAGTLIVYPLGGPHLHRAVNISVGRQPPAAGRLPTDYMQSPASEIVLNSIFTYVDFIRRKS